MDRYSVCFDGKWQGKFAELDDALDWAREVAETDRLVCVVARRIVRRPKLVAIFPEDRAEEGERLWRLRGAYGGFGGAGAGG